MVTGVSNMISFHVSSVREERFTLWSVTWVPDWK